MYAGNLYRFPIPTPSLGKHHERWSGKNIELENTEADKKCWALDKADKIVGSLCNYKRYIM